MIQAKRDRKTARRDTNSGPQTRSNADQGEKAEADGDRTKQTQDDPKPKAEAVDDSTKQSVDDPKTKLEAGDASAESATNSKVSSSPSNASSCAETLGTGTGSDKENTAPDGEAHANKDGSAATKAVKKAVWKQRRQRGKKTTGGNVAKNGHGSGHPAVDGVTESKDTNPRNEVTTKHMEKVSREAAGKEDVAGQTE
jgi:hypothetical protein